jgi:hypothetical protein
MSEQPSGRRAVFPHDYGARGGEGDEVVAWGAVEEKLAAATSYWLTTISPDGRPHARPVDGVWLDGALIFGGSPDTRWVRNLQRHRALSVHLPSGDDVVILEGEVELADADHPLGAPSRAAQKAKYPQYFPGDAEPPTLPFWLFRPSVAYAWALEGFPAGATRWSFPT